MRKALNLYSNIRPVKCYQNLIHSSPLKKEVITGVDFVVYRELTGGIYFGEKGRDKSGKHLICVPIPKKKLPELQNWRLKQQKERKKKVTLVDKANVLETSRLWREVVQNYAKNYPEVKLDCMFVDNAAMKLIQNPRDFDVILTENMFGDIISDEASVITGSLGMLPSASIGDKSALYEPIHGSYPQAAGKNIANPFASILSAAMLLRIVYSFYGGKCIYSTCGE